MNTMKLEGNDDRADKGPKVLIIDDPWRGPLTDEEKEKLVAFYEAAFPCEEKR